MLLFIIFAILSWFFFHHFYWKRRQFPWGPTPLPLVGNAFQLDPVSPHETIFKWKQEFGPIFTIWMGPTPFVIFAEYGIMKEYFAGKTAEVFASRPQEFLDSYVRNGRLGVSMTDGALWKEQRRFALHALRDFGVGRNLMELKIKERVEVLLETISGQLQGEEEAELSLDHPLELCVGNIINALMFGRVYQLGDERFGEMKRLSDALVQLFGRAEIQMLEFAPWLRFLPILGNFGFKEFCKLRRGIWALMLEEVEKNKRQFEADQVPNDFVSAYLKEMTTRKEKNESLGFFSDRQLACLVEDIWFAGQETTVTTLRWGLLYMLHYPQVQAEVQKEIDFQLGSEIHMSDRAKMPFTAATIHEIQRLANLVPINLFHTTAQEVQVGEFTLPGGTTVIPQISAVLMDPEIFPRPEKMEPGRFLDENGCLKKVEELVPFSMGKRVCLGESLAKMELFLIFTALLREFQFHPVSGEKLPSLEGEIGFTRRPKAYRALVKKRVVANNEI